MLDRIGMADMTYLVRLVLHALVVRQNSEPCDLVAGHTFLLVHASLFLIAEIAPLVPLLIGTQDQRKLLRDWQRLLAYGALAIQGLWAVMLFATSIYFHSPPEKFTGFIVGALGPVFSNYIIGT